MISRSRVLLVAILAGSLAAPACSPGQFPSHGHRTSALDDDEGDDDDGNPGGGDGYGGDDDGGGGGDETPPDPGCRAACYSAYQTALQDCASEPAILQDDCNRRAAVAYSGCLFSC